MNYHITITVFNKQGKIKRNANQSTRITQGQNSPANTDVPHHIAPLEILCERAKMAIEPRILTEDTLRSILPGLLHTSIAIHHRPIPSQFALNEPLSSFHTYIYGTVCSTIDSGITCLNTPPEGRLALSHSQPCRQGQLQRRRSEMCRWYDKEGESRDLVVTSGGKQKPIMILQAILPRLLTFK